MTQILFSLVLLLGPLNAFALVDYSEAEEAKVSAPAKPAARPAATRSVRKTSRAGSSSERSSSGVGMEFATQYDTIEVQANGDTSKFSLLKFDGSFQTPYSLFLDFSYFGIRDDEGTLGQSQAMQSGNGEVILGFNWLRFGKSEEMATLDLIGGMSISGSSELASSRTDKIFGFETSKRFYIFGLALGYRVHMTGTPKNEMETAIGGIQILNASLGVVVSPDIRVSVETGTIKVSKSGDEAREARLKNDVSFGYITPKLSLNISPLVGVDLGGTFRTRRVKEQDSESMLGARLWNLPGAYGNSIFAGLNISI